MILSSQKIKYRRIWANITQWTSDQLLSVEADHAAEGLIDIAKTALLVKKRDSDVLVDNPAELGDQRGVLI